MTNGRKVPPIRKASHPGMPFQKTETEPPPGYLPTSQHLCGWGFGEGVFLKKRPSPVFFCPCPYPLRYAVAKKMPPRIAAELRATRMVMGSLTNNTPPMAVITGTLNCTTAATVSVNRTTTIYQIT